jgi:hypothetical protein
MFSLIPPVSSHVTTDNNIENGHFQWGRHRPRDSALTLNAVGVTVFLPCHLGTVADQEAGIAGELVVALWNDLDDQLLGHKFSAGDPDTVHVIRFVQLAHDTARIGCTC